MKNRSFLRIVNISMVLNLPKNQQGKENALKIVKELFILH